jgi:hypothetical protein
VEIDTALATNPAGVAIAAMADDNPRIVTLTADLEGPAETWVGVHDGYPEGATVLSAYPQGLILEDGQTGAPLGGYEDLHTDHPGWQGLATFEDVVERLRTQFSTG